MEITTDAKKYDCPNCGGTLYFVPGTDMVHCDSCGSDIPAETFQVAKAGSGEKSEFDWGEYKKNLSEERLENTVLYVCSSCGAEIETDGNTVATRCPYCDSNVVLTERVGKSLRPNSIIPFKITQDRLPAAVKAFYRDKKLLPRNFFSASKLSKVQGIYIPFWLFSCKLEGRVDLKAHTTTHRSDSNYDYVDTHHYTLSREGEVSYAMVPVDASLKMDDALMDSLEPFDYSQLVDFNEAYLAGYLADRFDRDPDEELKRAGKRMTNSLLATFAREEPSYTVTGIRHNNMRITEAEVQYVMLPVYLFHNEYNGKTYDYAVNGQTGKVIGRLPKSKTTSLLYFLKYAAIFGLGAFLFGLLIF